MTFESDGETRKVTENGAVLASLRIEKVDGFSWVGDLASTGNPGALRMLLRECYKETGLFYTRLDLENDKFAQLLRLHQKSGWKPWAVILKYGEQDGN